MWVKHPTMTGDGSVSIAGPEGPIERKMIAGVFEWPDDLPLHTRYVQSEGPEELIREQRRREAQDAIDKLTALGIEVPESLIAQLEETETPVADATTNNLTDEEVQADITAKEQAVSDAQTALDSDPENADLKKALTVAKTALTKAKKNV